MNGRHVAFGSLFLGLVAFAVSSRNPLARAEYNNITQSDLANVIHAQVVEAGGTFTQTRAFAGLSKAVNQSVQIQGTGTSPNYKVEILVSLEGSTFTKPQVGGDLGTFTDADAHVVAVATPASVGHKLKITELGGSNSVIIEAFELSQ